MKVKELRQKSDSELTEMLTKLTKEMKTLFESILEKKEKNIKKAGMLKKDKARIKTVLNERKILNEGKKDE